MSQIANITVKKADGTTNVVYTAITGSSGDKSPALWKNYEVGTTPAERPSFAMAAVDNGNGTARRVRTSAKWPTVKQDAGGNKVITGGAGFEGSFLLPQSMTQQDINEFVHQTTNLLVSILVRGDTCLGVVPR